MCMHTHGYQTAIDAPPDTVWAALSDFGGRRWKPKVVGARSASDQTRGVGAAQLIDHLILKQFTVRATAWEEDERLTYTFEGLPPQIAAMANTWSVSPAETGSHVVVCQELELDLGPAIEHVAFFVHTAAAEELVESIGGLKCHVETGDDVTSDFLQVAATELRERYTSTVKPA